MKKSRLILLVLIVSFMLLGVGYATWITHFTINATVKTANFNVIFTDATAYSDNSTNVTATGTVDPNDPTSRTLQINLSNLYPGAKAGVIKTISNNSSVPVEINSASIVGSVNNNIGDASDTNLLKHTLTLTNGIKSVSYDVSDLISNGDDGLNDQLLASPITLAPGQSCSFTYTIWWQDQTAKGYNYNQDKYKDKTLSYTFNLGCIQAPPN